ncbi:FAD/NAD(P)-binding domain-containing protein [Hypoxylon sp. NC0597]|nr:FAD/NAD(P)-binding domain-containing protein [Hypoxylon sp. NC0597]
MAEHTTDAQIMELEDVIKEREELKKKLEDIKTQLQRLKDWRSLAVALPVQHWQTPFSGLVERLPEFSGRGAAVGLSDDARIALQHILPAARETLAQADAVPINSTRIILGSGPDAGSLVVDVDVERPADDKELIVHRASVLRELLAPLPGARLHSNKKLTEITETHHGIELAFQHGTTSRFDAVIVLIAKARAALGERSFDVPRQCLWAGDGVFVLQHVLENGSMVQDIISGIEKNPPTDRKRPLTREFLADAFQSWPGGSIVKGIIELLLDQPDPQGYSQYEHRAPPTYANGRVCIIGNAAYATTPWHGAGAGRAFEDAVILGTFLANISNADETGTMFKAYDTVKRPRCQRVSDSSRATGEIFTGQNKEVAMKLDELRSVLGER